MLEQDDDCVLSTAMALSIFLICLGTGVTAGLVLLILGAVKAAAIVLASFAALGLSLAIAVKWVMRW